MLKRANLGTRIRVLVLVGLVGIFTTSAAFAGPPAPSAHIGDANNDGWLNSLEVAGNVMVTGTYDATALPAVDHIRVFVVNNDTRQDLSSTCDIGASQVASPASPVGSPAGPITIATDGSGTWTAGPFNIGSFSEGAHVCARARASSNGGVSYSELAVSNNTPVIDTVAQKGSAALVDPNSDSWLNAAELTAGTVHEKYTASPTMNPLGTAPDDVSASVWYTMDAVTTPPAGCEATTFAPPASGENPVRAACIAAITEYHSFTLHAQWTDAAGNISLIADSNVLTKDTELPAMPTVTISDTMINKADALAVTVSGSIPNSPTSHLESGDRVDITVSDGATNRQVNTISDAVAGYTSTLNVSQLADCPTTKCINASAFVTDLAGNVGPVASTSDTTTGAMKDTVAPAAPVISVDPQLIKSTNVTFVEFSVCGETGALVKLTIDDDSAADSNAITVPTFTLSNCQTVNQDVSSLHDGVITATATLTDAFGNESVLGTGTAQKNVATSSAVEITSPAPGALTGKAVKITGLAVANSISSPGDAHLTVWDSYVDLQGNPRNRVALNGNPITADASGAWTLTHTFGGSGTHTIEAVTDKATQAQANIAKIVFDVDAVNPNATVTNVDRQVVAPGEPIVIQGDATDDFSGVYGVQIQIFDLAHQNSLQVTPSVPPTVNLIQGRAVVDVASTCPLCAPRATSVHWSYDASGLPAGYYTARVYAVDFKDNHSTQPYNFTFLKL